MTSLSFCRLLGLLLFSASLAHAEDPADHEVWIAIRADGRAGAGTQSNPFDGSSADKLDPILRRLLDVEHSRIHFGPGKFFTRSVLAADPVAIRKPHITIMGAGMYRTTLALDLSVAPKLPAWAFSVLTTEQQIPPDSHLTVQDMTFDTNWPYLKNARSDVSVGNINLTGSHCSLIRVRGINAHGDHFTSKECFAVSIGCGGPYDIHDGLIADCVVESPRGDYVNGIFLAGWTFDVYPGTTASGIVRGCKVYDMRADHKHMAAYAVQSGIITDCYAENSTIGVYMEYARDLTISNCIFRNNIWRGVWVCPANNYGGVRNLKVLNSVIEASNFFDGAACIEVGNGDEKNSSESVVLSGNTLLRRRTVGRNRAHSIISANGVPGLSIVGNKIDRQLDQSQIRGASMFKNRSVEGLNLSLMPDLLLAGREIKFLGTDPTAAIHKGKRAKRSALNEN